MCEVLMQKFIPRGVTLDDIEQMDLLDMDILRLAEIQGVSYQYAANIMLTLNHQLGLFQRVRVIV